ncbi:uncharacterized protein LOC124813388 [Hydra vulgaris]|uniref:uncharacterized protein LOC124813388 n=1 Tax=Hydra vulgaris TaxID=6087 RepID=UPI001F5EAC7B|nr:uncharacterized protein LOC124813388 [Hydra vulgaris]
MTMIPKSSNFISNLSYENVSVILQTKYQSDANCRKNVNEVANALNGFVMNTIDIVIGILIVILNVVLVNGIRKSRRKAKSYTHNEKLVLLLSSIDLLVALVYMPLEMVLVKMVDKISCIVISITGFWLVFTLGFSGSVVALISIERFNAVLNDKKCCGVKFNGVYATTVLCIHFLISSGLGVWHALLNYIQLSRPHHYYYFFIVATYTISNILSVLVMNSLLLIKSKKMLQTKEIRVAQHNVLERRLTQTMMVISITYIILYIPVVVGGYNFFVILYLNELNSVDDASKLLFWAVFFCKINSILNALIYITRNRNVQKFYKSCIASILEKGFCRQLLDTQFSSKQVSIYAMTVSESNKNVFI